MIYTIEYKGERKTLTAKAGTTPIELAVKAFALTGDVDTKQVRVLASSAWRDVIHKMLCSESKAPK